MKQGPSKSSDGGRKREPISHAISPGGVSQIGLAQGVRPESIHAGRGFSAPGPSGTTVHHGGSQGKHR